MPVAGSAVMIFGRPHSMTGAGGTGLLMLTVEDIVYSPGSTLMVDESRISPGSSGRKLQVRKRKYGTADTADDNRECEF